MIWIFLLPFIWQTSKAFELQNLAVDLSSLKSPNGELRPPLFFGQYISSPYGRKLIPNIEWTLPRGQAVIAPTDMVIKEIAKREDDYTIRATPWPATAKHYRLEIDHVQNVKVKVGQKVLAFQALGEVGLWSWPFGRVEIQVNDEHSYLCPSDFLAKAVKDQILNDLLEIIQAFEELRQDPNLYQEEKMHPLGCYLSRYQDPH